MQVRTRRAGAQVALVLGLILLRTGAASGALAEMETLDDDRWAWMNRGQTDPWDPNDPNDGQPVGRGLSSESLEDLYTLGYGVGESDTGGQQRRGSGQNGGGWLPRTTAAQRPCETNPTSSGPSIGTGSRDEEPTVPPATPDDPSEPTCPPAGPPPQEQVGDPRYYGPPDGPEFIAPTSEPTPEPGTLGLLALGALALRRRRHRGAE